MSANPDYVRSLRLRRRAPVLLTPEEKVIFSWIRTGFLVAAR